MSNNIRKLRKEKGMTIQQLADLTNISAVYIYHLENGTRKNPSFGVMKDIAKALGERIEEIFL